MIENTYHPAITATAIAPRVCDVILQLILKCMI